MSGKRIAKQDICLIAALLCIGLASLAAVRFMQTPGEWVSVQVDGQETGVYPLDKDQLVRIPIQGRTGNTLSISGGCADMVDADCPDRLCVHQKAISRQGETIVCLPHKVVIEIRSKQAAVLDSMSQ